MKVAILHPFQFRFARGIERFTWSLAQALAHKGVALDLLTWRWPNPVNWGQPPPLMRIKQMPYFRYFMDRAAVFYYLSWLASTHYDWVLLFFAGYGEAETLKILRQFKTQPYCLIFQYPYQQTPHRYAEFQQLALAGQADCLVGVSQYVAMGVEAQLNRACAVIGNGVDPQVFAPSPSQRVITRQQLGLGSNTPVLISLAALEERKGVQWVIRAIPHLLPEFPQLQYWVLGEGPYRQALEAEINHRQLKAHVKLWGRSENVVPYLAAADVGCLLSYGEAFGIALLEYMAMGLPVVASQRPPFTELIQPAWGRQVDETNPKLVAAELRNLLSAPQLRQDIGQAGRRQVLQRHTWDQVADGYLRLLALC